MHRGRASYRLLLYEVAEAIIAMYVVVNALVQYVFDAAAIETALEQLLAFLYSRVLLLL